MFFFKLGCTETHLRSFRVSDCIFQVRLITWTKHYANFKFVSNIIFKASSLRLY